MLIRLIGFPPIAHEVAAIVCVEEIDIDAHSQFACLRQRLQFVEDGFVHKKFCLGGDAELDRHLLIGQRVLIVEQALVQRVAVRVYEAGHEGQAVEVNDLCARIL